MMMESDAEFYVSLSIYRSTVPSMWNGGHGAEPGGCWPVTFRLLHLRSCSFWPP